MQEIVRQIINLVAEDKIDANEELLRSIMVSFLYNDFDIPYSDIKEIDVLKYEDIFKIINMYHSNMYQLDIENYRKKVANLLALLNIAKVKNIA